MRGSVRQRSRAAADTKPLLRGWSHALAAGGAVAMTLALVMSCGEDAVRAASMLVYGLSMTALFVISGCYHLGRWRTPWRERLRALDHATIYVLIAGTYTPIAVNVLDSWERVVVLGMIWALATVGAVLCVGTLRLPRWATAGLYAAMGWAALIPAPSLLRALPLAASLTLVAGGLMYTAGALVYAFRHPDPLPRVFGFHEVFHALVIAGAVAFAVTVWVWVVPFPRS